MSNTRSRLGDSAVDEQKNGCGVTNFDPYQPERQLPAESPYYPPSGPQYAVQPYVSQPYPVYGQQPGYAQPYPMMAYPMLRTSGVAVAGMVIGIIALFTFWIPFVDLLLGFLAIGLSWAGIVQAGRVTRARAWRSRAWSAESSP